MSFEELIANVEQWAEVREILDKATPLDQAFKTMEEVQELIDAVSSQDPDEYEIADAVGDIVVTLIIQCKMQGLNIEGCLNWAWNEIKDRRGKMVNGQFVKEVEG